jgi:uncharacterized protein (TIGR03084 family)
MTPIAEDFLAEGAALHALLLECSAPDWQRNTSFKSWTIDQVVQHLHGTDLAARLALTDAEAFNAMKREGGAALTLMQPTLKGDQLREAWWQTLSSLAALLGDLDERARVPWFGPDMGVRMFGTARQMETWAHGRAVFDVLGQERQESDRLHNIAVIGVKTYGWTFVNRGLEPPGPAPYVELTAPSGKVWAFNDYSEDNFIEESAVDFCHVVTQVRNIADVELMIYGEPAHEWMAIAQCFAGPPETPPAPGSRG